MWLRGQVGSLEWQPSSKGSKVTFSVPPTEYTQSANVQLLLKQHVFDALNPQLRDLVDVTFYKVPNDYEPQDDDIIMQVHSHNRSEGDVPNWVPDPVPGNPSHMKIDGYTHKRGSYLQLNPVNGGALVYGSVQVGVDTELVEHGHEPGDRFRVLLQRVELNAVAREAEA